MNVGSELAMLVYKLSLCDFPGHSQGPVFWRFPSFLVTDVDVTLLEVPNYEFNFSPMSDYVWYKEYGFSKGECLLNSEAGKSRYKEF